MRALVFSCHDFEQPFLTSAAQTFGVDLQFTSVTLSPETAALAHGYEMVSLFANDNANREALISLHRQGTRFLSLRCAGFNHVQLDTARELGLQVARVPEYSPYSVAEHTVGLLLTLNRKLHRAWARVREQNFSLNGLLGFDLHGKTIGIIGLGKIGLAFARIMLGFGCRVLVYDPQVNNEATSMGIHYVSLDQLLRESKVISLHCPLTPETQYIINQESLAKTQRGVFILNTGRGALIDSKALIQYIKSGHIGAVGLDVYEQESGIFFADRSGDILTDDLLARLMSFPNVFITGHQGFFTQEALENIANTAISNIVAYSKSQPNECWLT